MPPPSLSMTTMRTGVETSRRAARPPMSWSRPRSPVTIVVGRPLAWAAPIPEETRPSMPLAPRLQRKRASVVGRRQEGLLVADRHARGGVDEVAVAVGVAEGPVKARLGELVQIAQLRVERLARRAPRPRSRPRRRRRSSSPSRAAQPDASSVGSARRIAAARLRRLVPAAATGRRRSGRRRTRPARRAAACWSASRRSGGRGRVDAASAKALVAQQQVVGGDDVGAVVGPAAELRGRLGEDREAGGPGEVRRAARAARGRAGGRRRSRRSARRRCGRRPRRAGRPRAPCRSASPRSAAALRVPPAPAGRLR